MKINKIILLVIIIGIVLINGCIEQDIPSLDKNKTIIKTIESPAGVEYTNDVLEAFNKTEWLSVIVRLKDNSNIKIEGTTGERRALSKQRQEWFKPIVDEVSSTLPKDKIKLGNKLFDGFSAEVTKEGFEQLLNNPAVDKVIWDKKTIMSIQD